MNKNNKKGKILAATVASWGLMLLGSGTTMQMMTKPMPKNESQQLNILARKIDKEKSNEIKLKDIESEINQPISVNIKDYLTNPNDIDDKIISKMKLDTSLVNINQAGTYQYIITYNKKKYNGQFTIKEKQFEGMENLTLKSPKLVINSILSTNVQDYVTETIPTEVLDKVKLDLSGVNITTAGKYQFKVIYNGKMFINSIEVYEPQKTEAKIEVPKEINITAIYSGTSTVNSGDNIDINYLKITNNNIDITKDIKNIKAIDKTNNQEITNFPTDKSEIIIIFKGTYNGKEYTLTEVPFIIK